MNVVSLKHKINDVITHIIFTPPFYDNVTNIYYLIEVSFIFYINEIDTG